MTDLRFSVIITTFNRPAALARCLAALSRSDYPNDKFEVIVVDDGSAEPLEEIVARFSKEMSVRLIRQPNGGPAKGRNKGAEMARNEFLAFTDDDCEPAPGWLSALARRLQRSPDRLVGGHTVNGLKENIYSAASHLIVEIVYAFYNHHPDQSQFFATNNLALRTESFRLCGAFDERFRLSEDREFCNRWRSRGFALAYEPEAVVEHRHPLTFASFCRQHFRNGRAAAHFHRICTARGSGRLPDHLGFYGALPRTLREAARNGSQRIVQVVPLLALWRATNAAGFFYELLFSKSATR